MASSSPQNYATWPFLAVRKARKWFLLLGIAIPNKTGFLFMREKEKAEGGLDHKHLLCARHCSKHFTCSNSLESHDSPAMWILIILFWEMEAGADKNLVTHLISNQAVHKVNLKIAKIQRRAWSTGQAFWKMVVRRSERVQRRVNLEASHRTKLILGVLGWE